MCVSVDKDTLFPADHAGNGAGHRAQTQVKHQAGFGPAELCQISFKLQVHGSVAGQWTGTERRSYTTDRTNVCSRFYDFGMGGQAEIIVGCNLQVLGSLNLNVGEAVGNRKLTEENVWIEMIAGNFLNAVPKFIALVKNVWHENIFWVDVLK